MNIVVLPRKKKKISKSYIADLWLNQKISTKKICEELEISESLFRRIKRKLGVSTRSFKISKVCACCGKEFPVFPSDKDHKYCSRICFHKYQGERQRGRNNPYWKGGSVERVCLACKKIFPVERSELRRNGGKFCSTKCQYRYMKKENHPSWRGGLVKKVCKNCGKDFYITKANERRRQSKYCSMKCFGLSNRGSNHIWWKGGSSWKDYPLEFNRQLKELIRIRDGHRCQKCGCPEIENIKKLAVHHIDYNKQNLNPSNLISLCNRCNISVNAKRSKWTKFFRKKIRDITNESRQSQALMK